MSNHSIEYVKERSSCSSISSANERAPTQQENSALCSIDLVQDYNPLWTDDDLDELRTQYSDSEEEYEYEYDYDSDDDVSYPVIYLPHPRPRPPFIHSTFSYPSPRSTTAQPPSPLPLRRKLTPYPAPDTQSWLSNLLKTTPTQHLPHRECLLISCQLCLQIPPFQLQSERIIQELNFNRVSRPSALTAASSTSQALTERPSHSWWTKMLPKKFRTASPKMSSQ